MKKLKVLLVEDHEVVRHGLKLLIEAQPDMEVVGEASNGSEACRRSLQLLPDIVLMDISMPGIDGVQATDMLRTACPGIKVLILTAHQNDAFLRQVLKSGASGYVTKQATPEELIRAVRAVVEGGVYVDSLVAGRALAEDARRSETEPEARDAALSQREEEVVRLIAQGHTNKEIAARLSVSVNTVETYKSRIMRKLDLYSRADIVRFALRQGWLQ